VDRAPYWLFWPPWQTGLERWEREGMPRTAAERRAYFGVDQRPLVLPVNVGPCPAFPKTVLEESESAIVFVDTWGIVRRDLKGRTSMSQFLEFPVKGWDDWRRYKSERLDPAHPNRLGGNWREVGAQWTRMGWPIQVGDYPDLTVYGGLRWLLGDEECLLAFYTQPDLVHDIMDHLTTVHLAVLEEVVKRVRVDVIHIWEDMAGRQGPLISPAHWREFMGPNYLRVHRFAQAHGIRLISVDTDGQPDLIIPPMMEHGINYIYPFEVAAGCDVNQVQRRYPTLGLMGGIDKRALAEGPSAIDRELARIRPAVARGRYVPALDHLVPDDVSWANYCHYAEGLRKLVYETEVQSASGGPS
jgi:uroporphyrinogen decarboxylase